MTFPFVVVVASGIVATPIALVTNSVVAIAVVLFPAVWVIAVVAEGKTGVPVNVGESDKTTLPVPVVAISSIVPEPTVARPRIFPLVTF